MKTLLMGSEGPEVEKLQERLNEIFEDQIGVDGFFWTETRETVEAFQDLMGLNVDGKVGRLTWAALFDEEPEEEGATFPLMQRDLSSLMNPHDGLFRTEWLVFIDLTQFVQAGQIPKNGLEYNDGRWGFWGNRLMQKPFLQAVQNLVDTGLNKEWHVFSGCWCVRPMKSGNSLSVHAYALAVDINAPENPYNSSRHQFSDEFVNCFSRAGFESGGMWTKPKDWMHFQLAWNSLEWETRLAGTGLEPPRVPEV